jgi:hypothetical protein
MLLTKPAHACGGPKPKIEVQNQIDRRFVGDITFRSFAVQNAHERLHAVGRSGITASSAATEFEGRNISYL